MVNEVFTPTQEEYDTLSRIAPTVAQPAEYVDWGIPWQELTVKIGQIMGRQAEAEELTIHIQHTYEEISLLHNLTRDDLELLLS